MQLFVIFGLLGLGLGALYVLAGQGVVLIYRGSGVLNFAQGAVGMVAAFMAWDLQVNHGLSYWLTFSIGVGVATGIGVIIHLGVMRPLRHASSLARIVATLAVLIVLQGVAVIVWGTNVQVVTGAIPTTPVHLFSYVTISSDRLVLLAIAVVLTVVLWAVYRYTTFGLATSAVSENQRAAATLGWSPDMIAMVNWALGSALAGMAAILMAPIVELQVYTMTNVVLAALAAALIGRFTSFPIVLMAGLTIGVVQVEVGRYFITNPGVALSVPFAVIIAVMCIRGQAIPLRDYFLQRLPGVGSGRIRPALVIPAVIAVVLVIASVSVTWQEALTLNFGFALVLLSIVVLTGYTGQISLAQYAMAGLGAWITARLEAAEHLPFVLAACIGVVALAFVGMVVALPAVRSRGMNLAIATLGVGTAIELLIFDSNSLSGGYAGTVVAPPRFLGVSFDPIVHPDRYAYLVFATFVVAALAVANVRRGRTGRRMLAVRTNERAAAALGISVPEVKVYAFALSSAIAAVGGIAIAYMGRTIIFSDFTNFTSVNAVGWSVIGGVGYIAGPVIGATLAPGTVGTHITNSVLPGLTEYIVPFGGVLLILILIQNEDGAAKQNIIHFKALGSRLTRAAGLSRRRTRSVPTEIGVQQTPTPVRASRQVAGKVLRVDGIGVHYGGIVAVDDLSLALAPGQVVGLIGPNGAGKTTAIDAITGFVRLTAGRLSLDGRDITGASAAQRARLGISRSFQSLELFEDMTVLDNLRTAAEPRDRTAYLLDLVFPRQPALSPAVAASVDEFELTGDLERLPPALPFGRRRLLAIARAVAAEPSVLLLDEPAAGLGDVESHELARLVRHLADDWRMAVMVVEHDMNFVMGICDEVVVIDFGRTIAVGPPDVVRRDPATIAAYLGETPEEQRDDEQQEHVKQTSAKAVEAP